MASATWLAPLKKVPWSQKALFAGLFVTAIAITIIAVWLIALPKQSEQVTILPQFASAAGKTTRVPINLPSPAAGSSDEQGGVTVPLKLPEQPKKPKPQPDIQKDAQDMDVKTEAVIAQQPVSTPKAQTPRALLAKLSDTSAGAPLPIIAGDGTTPFDAYQAKTDILETDDRARISLIVTGIGLSTSRSDQAFSQLPASVTVAISPYARTPQTWIEQAFKQGRDVLIMVPMEPNSFPTVDPGPDTLMRDAPTIQTLERLHTVLGKMQGYIGIINDTGSRFTANEIAVGPVLDDIAKRGLMVVDARASSYSVLAAQAKKRSIPVAANTRFIDSSLSPADIDRQLRDLERTAQTLGAAVGIMRDLPISIARVNAWQKSLNRSEIVLAPISAVANRQPIR